jgi:hypothetical protein
VECREDKEVRMMMLEAEGLAKQVLGVIVNSNLVVWMMNSWQHAAA